LPCTTTSGASKARAQGVAVLYIHALNPYGFSHIRRVTQENVDLNRNFHDFLSKPLPVNAAYRELQPLLLPAQWPPAAGNVAAMRLHRQHGMRPSRPPSRGAA
jgi:hypothetical protein